MTQRQVIVYTKDQNQLDMKSAKHASLTSTDKKVDYGGVISISTVDWFGKSSCVIFFNKCPFRCNYCQNYKLLDNTNLVDIELIKNKIEESSEFASSVVFSGGEPTMQKDALKTLCQFSKDINLDVGLETNGYYYETIQSLSEEHLVDKIFIDLKASPLDNERYSEITKCIDSNISITKTFNTLLSGHIQFEVRTPVFRFNIKDILSISSFLQQNNYKYDYVLQQGIPTLSWSEEVKLEKQMTEKELKMLRNLIVKNTGIKVKLKTING